MSREVVEFSADIDSASHLAWDSVIRTTTLFDIGFIVINTSVIRFSVYSNQNFLVDFIAVSQIVEFLFQLFHSSY